MKPKKGQALNPSEPNKISRPGLGTFWIVLGIGLLIAWLMIPVGGLVVQAWTCRNAPGVLVEGVAYPDVYNNCGSYSGDVYRGLFFLSFIATPIIPVGSFLVWRGLKRRQKNSHGVSLPIKGLSIVPMVYAVGLIFLALMSALATLIYSGERVNGGLNSSFWFFLIVTLFWSGMAWITYKSARKSQQLVKVSKG